MQCEQKFWVVTASADHAENGKAWGIVQACHGKVAPLRRMQAGDGVVIYSPKAKRSGGEAVMAFTAIGRVSGDAPYLFDMGGGFVPFRRDVAYVPAQEASILPLLDQFEFVEDRRHWGYPFRFGLFKIGDGDMRLIAQAMQAQLQGLHLDLLLFQ